MEPGNAILQNFETTLAQLAQTAGAHLPTLLTALAALLVGLAAAWAARALTLRFATGAGDFLRGHGFMTVLGGRRGVPFGTIVAGAAFWFIVTISVAVFMRMLGLGGPATWLAAAARYLPAITGAATILVAGYFAAAVLSEIVRRGLAGNTDPHMPRFLSRLTFWLISVIAGLAALRQLNIDLVLIRTLIIVVASTFLGAIALAFGLGARSSVSNLVAAHYVRALCRRGQRLKLGAIEGEILSIAHTSVILDTAEGRVVIPADYFNREVVTVTGVEEER